MIFDGKSLEKITEDEIKALVKDNVAEKQHLEFKATVNYKNKEEKLELLRDIASLANGGGGYFIIGIGDDGTGRAAKFENKFPKPTESIKQSIQHLCIEHISERIYGLDIETRTIDGNPIVIIKIPESVRKPHMVTFGNRTDFWSRYHDGKREMTIGEIRDAFLGDIVARRLDGIESAVKRIGYQSKEKKNYDDLINKIENGEIPSLLEIKDGHELSEIASKLFQKQINEKPFLWISITPRNPKRDLIDIDSDSVQKLIKNPPDTGQSGWNLENTFSPIKRVGDGIHIGEPDFRYLILLENGHMEFWTPLDQNFCWRQSEEEFKKNPRLYPYPVTKYPVSFLKLYRAIIDNEELQSDFILKLHYRNLLGYTLAPYRPGIIGFEFAGNLKSFTKKHLEAPDFILKHDFDPDKEAYKIIKFVYNDFGYGSEKIPFYNEEEDKFLFSS